MNVMDYVTDNYKQCVRWATSCLPRSHRQDAEDVVMEAMFKVLDGGQVLKDKTAQTFVFMVIRNKAIDHMRGVNSKAKLTDDYEARIRTSIFHNGDSYDPAHIIEAEDQMKSRADTLSPLLAHTLREIIIEGTTPEELAQEQNVSPAVVYKRVERAKKTLIGELNNDK